LRIFVALSVVVCAAVAAVAAASPAPKPSALWDEARPLIETLFTQSRNDSVLLIVPDYIRRAEATGDSVTLGRLILDRGRALLAVGRHDEAGRDIDVAIEIAEAVHDTLGWMPALQFRGYAYWGQQRNDDAMHCYEKRLDLAQRVRSIGDEAWARTAIAYVLHQRGDHLRAKEEYTRSIDLFRRSEHPALEVTPLIGLGRVESALGDVGEAIRCYERAWVVSRRIGDRMNEMWATNNLGVLEMDRGDLGRGVAYQERAFELAKEMNSPRAIVIPAANVAGRARELGEFERAQKILDEARVVCSEKGAEDYLSTVDFHRADLFGASGKPNAAEAIYRRLLAPGGGISVQSRDIAIVSLAQILAAKDSVTTALELMTSSYDKPGAAPFGTAAPYVSLEFAQLYMASGDPDRALDHTSRARDQARSLGWKRLGALASLRESVCYRALGRDCNAAASLFAALDSLESSRGAIRSPEWREVYGQDIARNVVDAASLLLDYPQSSPRGDRMRVFFDTVQRFEARTLLDRISEPRRDAAAATPRLVTAHDLQHDVLAPGELLLEFLAGNSMSYLIAVSRDSLRVATLSGSKSPLAERIDVYRRIVTDASTRSDYPPDRLAAMQRGIGTAVFGGVADLLSVASRVVIVPDGYFAGVPFATLIVSSDGHMLVENHDVEQVPSATVLALQRSRDRENSGKTARIVALEAPSMVRLSGASDEVRRLARRYAHVTTVHGIEGGVPAFAAATNGGDVVHIAAHAHAVDQSPWQSGIQLFDTVGTAAAGPPAGAVVAGDSSSDFTTLRILSTADSMLVARTFRGDSFVRAWEIAGLSLTPRLAVLSGCETAGGRATTGEGVLGLTSAFLSAGVPVVVSSLWPVDDRVTATMMGRFYSHLADGHPVGESLRQAQLDMRRDPGTAHPFYWAGFVCVGDGAAVIPVARRAFSPAIFAVLVAIATALLVAVRRRRSRADVR
jgi:tetratricopeptide (TPR) repeat protein